MNLEVWRYACDVVYLLIQLGQLYFSCSSFLLVNYFYHSQPLFLKVKVVTRSLNYKKDNLTTITSPPLVRSFRSRLEALFTPRLCVQGLSFRNLRKPNFSVFPLFLAIFRSLAHLKKRLVLHQE
jgi:hypothetical protein